jgi:glycosyltransferase involved in cell wall biosynthesis
LLAPAGADGASPPEPFGRLIPPGDARALAEAILELAVDPARRADLAGRARERALAAHDPDAWAARIEAIYREAIASRSR